MTGDPDDEVWGPWERAPDAGQLCPCGRPAEVVYLDDRGGADAYCGVHDYDHLPEDDLPGDVVVEVCLVIGPCPLCGVEFTEHTEAGCPPFTPGPSRRERRRHARRRPRGGRR